MKKSPLAPLIPLDELKSVVTRLAQVSKEQIGRLEAQRPKRKRNAAKKP